MHLSLINMINSSQIFFSILVKINQSTSFLDPCIVIPNFLLPMLYHYFFIPQKLRINEWGKIAQRSLFGLKKPLYVLSLHNIFISI